MKEYLPWMIVYMISIGGAGFRIAVALPRGPVTEEVTELNEHKVLLEKIEDSLLLPRLPSGGFGLVAADDMR